MLQIDEDDFFVGSPESKFFDILFNANKNLVIDAMQRHIEEYAAMKLLLEKLSKKTDFDIEEELMVIKNDQLDDMHNQKTDFYITTVGDVLTQHE